MPDFEAPYPVAEHLRRSPPNRPNRKISRRAGQAGGRPPNQGIKISAKKSEREDDGEPPPRSARPGFVALYPAAHHRRPSPPNRPNRKILRRAGQAGGRHPRSRDRSAGAAPTCSRRRLNQKQKSQKQIGGDATRHPGGARPRARAEQQEEGYSEVQRAIGNCASGLRMQIKFCCWFHRWVSAGTTASAVATRSKSGIGFGKVLLEPFQHRVGIASRLLHHNRPGLLHRPGRRFP